MTDEIASTTKQVVGGFGKEVAAAVDQAGERLTSMLDASRKQISDFAEAARAVQDDILKIQEGVKSASDKMLSDMESGIREALGKQRQTSESMTARMIESMQEAVSKTGEGVNEQLEALDEARTQDLNRTLQQMGTGLAQMTGQFTKDFKPLVDRMHEVTKYWQSKTNRERPPR